jgi:transcription initiation factor IIF auxiliary subunit
MIELKDLAGRLHNIVHDLNFSNARYETKQIITFKNPKGALLDALRNSGPIPGEAATNGADASSKKRTSEIGAGNTQKKKKGGDGKAIDMDKLAEGLQKLGEDDLLQVVQMVHDNKSEDSWMRNDVERMCTRKSVHLASTNQSTLQRANSTSICIPSQRILSRCSGISRPRRTPFRHLHRRQLRRDGP